MSPYRVLAHDLFHFAGDAEPYRLGDFDDCAAARATCRRLVDEFLSSHLRTGTTAAVLWEIFQAEGVEPWIVPLAPASEDCVFAAARYARRRCRELTSAAGGRR